MMRKLCVCALAVVALCALASAALVEPLSDAHHEMLFAAFLKQHSKVYESRAEHAHRFGVFKANLQYVREHNAGGHSFELAMNHFGDMTNEEYRAEMLSPHAFTDLPTLDDVRTFDAVGIPDSFDWRAQGKVTSVKNQGQCGSCWAFTTAATMETAWAIKTGSLMDLSPQQLVDCSTANGGCNGGDYGRAYAYIASTGGIDTWGCYPYTGSQGACHFNSGCVAARISNYVGVQSGCEQCIANAIATTGAVAVAIDASGQPFQFYSGGVFAGPCGTSLNHAVTAVGYGRDGAGTPYFIIKNSWGSGWGQGGYIMMRAFVNLCGIGTYGAVPIA